MRGLPGEPLLLHRAFVWYRASKDGPIDALADELLEMVLNGVVRAEQKKWKDQGESRK